MQLYVGWPDWILNDLGIPARRLPPPWEDLINCPLGRCDVCATWWLSKVYFGFIDYSPRNYLWVNRNGEYQQSRLYYHGLKHQRLHSDNTHLVCETLFYRCRWCDCFEKVERRLLAAIVSICGVRVFLVSITKVWYPGESKCGNMTQFWPYPALSRLDLLQELIAMILSMCSLPDVDK